MQEDNEFDEGSLRAHLVAFPQMHVAAFAVACADRAHPLYRLFHEVHATGSLDNVSRIIAGLWEAVANNGLPASRIAELSELCELAGPHTDDFGTVYGALAERVAASAYFALQCIEQTDVDSAVFAAQAVIDAIDNISDALAHTEGHTLGPLMEPLKWAIGQPLKATEIRKQEADLSYLSTHPILTTGVVDVLKMSNERYRIEPGEE